VQGPFAVLKPPITLHPRDPKAASSSTAGPIAHWTFDEADGLVASSLTGTNYNGRLRGNPVWAPTQGKLKGALQFNGVRDSIEIATSADANFPDRITLALWARANPGPTNLTLAAKGTAWHLQWRPASREIQFALLGPATTGADKLKSSIVSAKAPLADAQWHHLAASYDGSRLTVYIDGKEAGSVAATGPIALNNLPLTLGSMHGIPASPWSGALDDARLYNRALTPDEIKSIAQ
jgi:hypothetical protein